MDPKEYDTFSEEARNNVSLFLKEFSKNLINISGKCMDIGCGPGYITGNMLLPALDPNAVVIGTDISKEMVEYANKTYGNKERLYFDVLDIQTESLPKEYISGFDNIFSFHTLHWCFNFRQALENIYRMVRPGGNMFVLFVANDIMYDVFKMMTKDERFAPYITDIEKYISPFHKVDQPTEKFKSMLESIGFRVHHCNHLEKSLMDVEVFISMIVTVFPFLNVMSQNIQKQFINDFKRNFINHKVKSQCESQQYNKLSDDQKGPSSFYPYSLLIAHAQKDT